MDRTRFESPLVLLRALDTSAAFLLVPCAVTVVLATGRVLAAGCDSITIKADTSVLSNTCTEYAGPDFGAQVAIPCDGDWTFSVTADFDWIMAVGTAPCASDVALSEQTNVTVTLTAGTYDVTIDGDEATDEGEFVLNIFFSTFPEYRVTDLGRIGSNGWNPMTRGSFGINSSAQVAYAALDANGDLHARIWDGSNIVELDAPASTGQPSVARDINEAGQLVGQASGLRINEGRGVVWVAGESGYDAVVIPPFGDTSCPWSRAHAINDDDPPMIVGESDAVARCRPSCLAGMGDFSSSRRGFTTTYPSLSLTPLGSGRGFACYPSTYALDVSDTPVGEDAVIAGFANLEASTCFGPLCIEGDNRQAAAWADPLVAVAMDRLHDRGSEARAVNDAGNLAGWAYRQLGGNGRPIALFWESPTENFVRLGDTMPEGQGENSSRAFGMSNPDANSVVYVAGTNETVNLALLWQRDALDTVSVKDLNTAMHCRGVVLEAAYDVNKHGDIVAKGEINSVDHVLLLTEFAPACPGDLNGDGVVSFADILEVLAAWGERCGEGDVCTVDANADCIVDFADILFILTEWGPCGQGPEPPSAQDVIEGMGLAYPSDWLTFMDEMANAPAAVDQQNLACWIIHYYEFHYLVPVCIWMDNCPAADPYGQSHFPY